MPFLAGAMIALWAMISIYVVYLSLRQRRLESELATLEEDVSSKS